MEDGGKRNHQETVPKCHFSQGDNIMHNRHKEFLSTLELNGNNLEENEYMAIHIDDITSEYRTKYIHMTNKDGKILIDLSKTIYDLRQAGQIARRTC